MKLLQISSAVLLSLYLGACSAEPSHTHDGDDHDHVHEGDGHGHDEDGIDAALAAVAPSANASVHALKCGCAIDGVGKCGEYIEVDGSFIALELPVDLGKMPFCRQDGLKAAVDGEVKDGTFVASSFAYRE